MTEVPYTSGNIDDPSKWGNMTYYWQYKCMGAGLIVGLSCLASGLCIGVVGDAGVRGNAQRENIIAMILMLIFGEALALYGFILAMVLSSG